MIEQNSLTIAHQVFYQPGWVFFLWCSVIDSYQHPAGFPRQPVRYGRQFVQCKQFILLMQHFIDQFSVGNSKRQLYHTGIGLQLLFVYVPTHHQLGTFGTGEYRCYFQPGDDPSGIHMQEYLLHTFGIGIMKGPHHKTGYRFHGAHDLFQFFFGTAAQPVQRAGLILQQAHFAASSSTSV